MGIFDFFKKNKNIESSIAQEIEAEMFLQKERTKEIGKIHGKSVSFHKNGEIRSEIDMKDGKNTGSYKQYRENGILFKHREKNGMMKYFFEDGVLNCEGKTEDNNEKRIGFWKHYYKTGNLFYEGDYIEGEKNGIFKYYHENKKIHMKGNLKDGKEEGLWQIFGENGQLEQEGNYKNGNFLGLWKYYYENGQLKAEGKMKDDYREGVWKYYNEDGKLDQEIEYIEKRETRELSLNSEKLLEDIQLQSFIEQKMKQVEALSDIDPYPEAESAKIWEEINKLIDYGCYLQSSEEWSGVALPDYLYTEMGKHNPYF